MKAMKTVITISLIAWLWAVAIAGDTLGLDTGLRLQMAHSWWTGTAEVAPKPGYKPQVRGDIRWGVIGTGGKRYIAYEVGQPMLMVPGDWVGEQMHHVFPGIDSERWRRWAVTFLIFTPINVGAVVACFGLLRLFGFNEQIAGWTSITLLLSTTVLFYTQMPQHNNQLLLLVTTGYATALAYLQQRRNYFIIFSGLALGLAFLIRSTVPLHVATVLLFLVGYVAYKSRSVGEVAKVIGLWLAGYFPFAFIGRFCDYLRYGDFWVTGKMVEQQQLATDPMWAGLPPFPPNYPLINPPSEGILGPLLSPAKSIFLYDPLLIPCIVLGAIAWQQLSPLIRWYLVTVIINLGLHLLAYSRFVFWHGDFAWGARYHVTSVHLLLMPLLAVFIQRMFASRGLQAWVLRGLLALAIACQLASVMMPMGMEIVQKTIGAPGSRLDFRLAQRFTNIVCLINDSISPRCTTRLSPDLQTHLKRDNRIAFLPFIFRDSLPANSALNGFSIVLFIVWGMVAIAAIATTVIYLRPLFQP
jgi:hypothetical protein